MNTLGLVIVVILILLVIYWLYYYGALNWFLPAAWQSTRAVNFGLPAGSPYSIAGIKGGVSDAVASIQAGAADSWAQLKSLAGMKEGVLGVHAHTSGRGGCCWVNTGTGAISCVRPDSSQPGWLNRCNYS